MTTTRFLVPAMDCANEKEVIADRLQRLGEVESMDFDLLDRVVTVRHKAGADARVEGALRDLGMKPQRLVDPKAIVTTRFHVAAMDCATEKEVIANGLDKVAGIEGVDFNLIDRVVTVRHQAGAEARVEDALREIDMKPKRLGEAGAATPASPTASSVERPSLAGAAAWKSRGRGYS